MAMKKLILVRMTWLTLAAAASFNLSCGGDGGDNGSGTCSMPAACGGAIAGNWTVTSSCLKVSGTLTDSFCPTATIGGSLDVAGTAMFSPDMTYAFNLTGAGTLTLKFPASCLMSGTQTISCTQLNQQFAANPPPPPTTSVVCTAAGGGACNCAWGFMGPLSSDMGTYTTAGNNLTTTSAGTPPETEGYCVKGNALTLTPSPVSDEGFSFSGSLTLAK